MAHPVLMPKPGQMTEECTVVAWHKAEGDPVHKGDVLFEIETDKANMDVEAFDEGVLLRTLVSAGETVPVNTVCGYVGQPGEALPERAVEPERVASRDSASTASGPTIAVPSSTLPRSPSPPAAAPSGRRTTVPISPRAARLAASSGINPTQLTGTGPNGRIVERDVQAALAAAPTAVPAPPSPVVSPPSARSAERQVPGAAMGLAEDEELQPLSRMRQVIAERLSWSASTIPHFTVTVRVDMTGLVALRQELKASGTLLSVTDFVLLATAQTLTEFPEVNSRTDGSSVWLRRRVHLGFAAALPNGLVVPVIRDADRLSLLGIHERAASLADAARTGRLSVDDMTGSTFTVSNLGMHGVDEFSAIINPGEAAILAVSSITPTPIAVGSTTADGIAVRQLMKLTLSADHRLVDGELGARFLNALRRRLEETKAFRSQLLNS